MYIPFPSVAEQATAHTSSYSQMILAVQVALPGFEKAKALLNLFASLKTERKELFTLFTANPAPDLQQAIRDTAPLVEMCHSIDGLYFCPTPSGIDIHAFSEPRKARDSWIQILREVAICGMSGSYEARQAIGLQKNLNN